MKIKFKNYFKKVFIVLFMSILTLQSLGLPQSTLANSWYRTVIINPDTNFYIEGTNPDGKPFLLNQQGIYTGHKYEFDTPSGIRNVAFCIEPMIATDHGEVYSDPIPISSYSKITTQMQKELGLIGHYGYYSNPNDKNRQFTQMLIWEHRGATLEAIRYKDVDVKSEYNTFKTNVMFHVNSHVIKPSFNNMTYEVNAGETITITDTNGYFKDFSLVDSGGFSLNHNGIGLQLLHQKLQMIIPLHLEN